MLTIHSFPPRSEQSELLMELDGRLDTEGSPQLEQALAALPQEVQTLILDLNKLSYLSSAGLGALLQTHRTMTSREGQLLLCCATDIVEQVLELSGISRMLQLKASREQALAASHAALTTSWTLDASHGRLAFAPCEGEPSHLELWEDPVHGDMFQTSLAELGICLGHGGFGNRREQAQENRGVFFSGRTVAALLPDGAMQQPLFLATRYPNETVLFVARGLSVDGAPLGRVDFSTAKPVSLGAFLCDMDNMLPAPNQECGASAAPPRVCLLFVDQFTPSVQDGAPAAGAVLLTVHYRGPRDSALPQALSSLPWRRDGDLNCCALALTLNTPASQGSADAPIKSLEAISEVERMASFMEVGPEASFAAAKAWVWNPNSMRSAREKLLEIDLPEGVVISKTRDALVRRLFAATAKSDDSPTVSRLQLIPLRPMEHEPDPGLFLVRRATAQGAALPPALLELDTAEHMQQALEAFRQHVQFLLENNRLNIENQVSYQGQGALNYFFTDQPGPFLELTTMAQHYVSLAVADLLPIFDRLFTEFLKPWYGRPMLEQLQLFKEHDPLALYPDILDCCQTELGLSPDKRFFDSHELGRPLRNPFHVLAHVFPKRREETRQWYASVVHGDLNLHNVLFDNNQGLCIVGFHATRRGNVVSDMARLEPILLLEHARLANENETDSLARFLESWYAAPSYAAVPPFGYAGSDLRISKAYQVMRRLRAYANTVTLFENDMRPYLLAVLQWTLPAVTFRHWEPERKRLAAIMGGVLCEQILGELAP